MKKTAEILILCLLLLQILLPAAAQSDNSAVLFNGLLERNESTSFNFPDDTQGTISEDIDAGNLSETELFNEEDTEEEESAAFEDSIQIDGRNYKVAPGFVVPAGIDINSPVKINFDENTQEVVSIERLVDDTAVNDFMEYHFGVVNTISKANTNLQYRVYVEGVGYLFDNHTKIDESIAFLDKYATVAVITYQGRVVMCKVFASNKAINEEDIFFGSVDFSTQNSDGILITVKEKTHLLTETTEVVGPATALGSWVFGYEINGTVQFVSVVTDSFPVSEDVKMFKGFVTFVGNVQSNGIYYLTVNEVTCRIMPDSAVNDQFQIGDYVVGYELNNDILTANKVDIPYDKSRYQIYYQPISDVVKVTDYTVPGYKRIVSIILNDMEIPLELIPNAIGELDKDVPVMAIFKDGEPQIIMAVNSIEPDRVPVFGYVTSVSGKAPNYEMIINGTRYYTSFATTLAAVNEIVPGTQIAGIANRVGQMDLMTAYETILPNTDQYLYAGRISKIAVNAFQIDDRIIDYDEATNIHGKFKEGKFAAVSKLADYAEMIYIIPDEYTDYEYKTYSGVLNGLRANSSKGRRPIRLDEEVFYLTPESKISKNLVYDEIGTVLYKGLSEVSVIDVLLKPNDLGGTFSGKVLKSSTDKARSLASFMVGNNVYNVQDVSALIGFNDVTRIYPGAQVEGYVYGDDVLAIRLVRGAGLFGILNPPWMEYVLVAVLLGIILLLLLSKLVKDRTSWKTGYVDIGAQETIILHEQDGKINNYDVDPDLFVYLTSLNEEVVTVKVKNGKIIEVK